MIGAVPKRDPVQVVTCNGTVVEISAAGREEIVAELHRHEQGNPELSRYLVLGAFESDGEGGRVNLDSWTEANLIDTIRNLAERVGGESRLDPGVAKLYRTLLTERRAREAEKEAKDVSLQVQAWFRERGFEMTFSHYDDDPGAEWWVNLHRIERNEGEDLLAFFVRIDRTKPAMPRYARGSTADEAAASARERYEREQS